MKVSLRSAAVFALAAAALAAHAQFNTNLVANPGAEMGTPNGGITVPVPGWTTTGAATIVAYDTGSFPSSTDPGPGNRGLNFFAGGPENTASALAQTFSLGFGTSTIDAGRATFSLAAFLGGFSDQDDNTVLTATFLNGLGASLGSATLGPVLAQDRNYLTGLLARSTSGAVPVGTRSVNLTMNFTRFSGSYNDGYADNVSFVLGGTPPPSTPEPGTWAALGLGALALLKRRRRA